MASTTEAVLKHHVQALVSRNLDDIMEDYSGNSVLFTPNGVFKGLESIRGIFTAILGVMTPEVMANLKDIRRDIDGEYAYVLWSAVPVAAFGGETFRVHNGEIVMQSIISQMGS
jgi:ketosteroid isomerase-like protein